MGVLTRGAVCMLASLGLLLAGAAVAESPLQTNQADGHSMEVKGRVSMYRVKMVGEEYGKGEDKAHAKVMISLDSKPGMIYTLSLHNPNTGETTANQEMAKALRVAYMRSTPVVLHHQAVAKQDSNFRIVKIQQD